MTTSFPMTRKVVELFPTPLYSNNIGTDFKFCDTDLYNHPTTYGNISVDQKYLLKIKSLKEVIDNEIEIYIRKYLRLKTNVYLKHQCSWLLVHKKGDYSPQHYHRNSWLSGIYYHKVDDNSGDIEFIKMPPYGWTDNLMNPCSECEELNNITANSYIITPQSGDLLLFPSHLVHKSYRNESNSDRVCVSFNYTLHGSWGTSTQYISI
tara:strand:+ start:107 stop:727 length:621 start_codon:yes stop_codon:yes gene_type:complete